MSLNCENCGFENEDDSKFCLNCGSPIENQNNSNAKVQCPFCHSSIPVNVIKCRYCGEWVKNHPQEHNTENMYKSYDYTILFGYIFAFLGGILGFIIGIYLLTRDDEVAKKHGKYQLIISAVIIVLFLLSSVVASLMHTDYYYDTYYSY